jgi:sugar O-acyltransferase (sialic acid O-acetyltransferase NeuD family)
MISTQPKDILFGLIGAGGFAREIMPIAAMNLSGKADLTFVESAPAKATVNGYDLLSEEAFEAAAYRSKMFNIAIADSRVREKFAKRLNELGHTAFSLSAASVTIYDEVQIGEGAILCANVVLTSNAKIGKFFHANLNSYVAHDCIIGDYVTFAPNVACNGNVHIGDHAYIGTGAILKQGSQDAPRRIGEGAVVGMGAVVTKDVAPHTTVVGNPARVLENR